MNLDTDGRTPLQAYLHAGKGVGDGLRKGREGYDVGLAGFAGVNVDKSGRVFPRISRAHYDNIYHNFMGKADNTVMERLLRKIIRPGSAQWKEYVEKRTGRVCLGPDGKTRYQIITNVEPVMAKLARARARTEFPDRVKKYSLNSVFADSSVREKYGISVSLLRNCQLLAINDPTDAAATLQDYMQRRAAPGVTVRVSAEHCVLTRGLAIKIIGAMAATLPTVVGVDSQVTGEILFMRHPDGRWKVSGPLRYANVVKDVYNLCLHTGPQEAIHLFGRETSMLKIDAYIDDRCVNPTIEAHVGPVEALPVEDSVEALSYMTPDVRDRYESRKCNVGFVSFEGGEVDGYVSSSVRVERRLVLINGHVKSFGDSVKLKGKLPRYEMPVGSDVWAVSDIGIYRQWVLRDAKIGELAAVMYNTGTKVCLSDPFQIEAVDGSLVYSSGKANVVPGMSGGALVALKDMALLGIHTGEMIHCLVSSAITTQVYVDVVEYLTKNERPPDAASDVFSMVRSRGAERQLRSLLPSLMAVYDGDSHTGTAAVVSPGVVATTVDKKPYDGLFPLDLPTVNSYWLGRAEAYNSISEVREPRVGEDVYCLGRDAAGFFTSSMTKVKYVAADARLFLLESVGEVKYTLTGAVVVSLQDCVVLGMVGSVSETGGSGSVYCTPLPGRESVSLGRVLDIERTFPALRPSEWPKGVVDAVFDLDAVSVSYIDKGRQLARFSEAEAVNFWVKSPLHKWGSPMDALPERYSVFSSVEALIGAVCVCEGEEMAKSLVSLVKQDGEVGL